MTNNRFDAYRTPDPVAAARRVRKEIGQVVEYKSLPHKGTVGEFRQQSPYCDHDRPIVIILDEELRELIGQKALRVVRCYPDTTDANGDWNSTFKIEVSR